MAAKYNSAAAEHFQEETCAGDTKALSTLDLLQCASETGFKTDSSWCASMRFGASTLLIGRQCKKRIRSNLHVTATWSSVNVNSSSWSGTVATCVPNPIQPSYPKLSGTRYDFLLLQTASVALSFSAQPAPAMSTLDGASIMWMMLQ